MLIAKEAPFFAISLLTVTAATTLPLAVLCAVPQGVGYLTAKVAARALKEGSLSATHVPAIRAGLLTLTGASIIAGFFLLGPLCGSVYAICLVASFFLRGQELDKAAEHNRFMNDKI